MSIWALKCKESITDSSKNFPNKFQGQLISWTYFVLLQQCIDKSPVCVSSCHPPGLQDLLHGAWPAGSGGGDPDAEVQWSPEHGGAWGGDEADGGVPQPFQIHEKQGTERANGSSVFTWAQSAEGGNVPAWAGRGGLCPQAKAGKQNWFNTCREATKIT